MAQFILKYLNIHSSTTENHLRFLSQTISEFQSIENQTWEEDSQHFVSNLNIGNSFCYSYDEKLSLHKNAQKELTFKMNRTITREDRIEENPFVHNLVIGSQLLLIDKYNNQYLFTVDNIKYTFKEFNMIYDYSCIDSFSYQLTRQNLNYSIENNSSSEDYIGSQTIDWWVKEKIQPDCKISYHYIGLNEELYLTNNNECIIVCPEKNQTINRNRIQRKIKSIYTGEKYNETIPFSGSGTSNSILISLGEIVGLMLSSFEYVDSNGNAYTYYWFEPTKHEENNGLKYSPYSDIQQFSLSHSGKSLATVLNIEGPTVADENITLFPEIPVFFKELFQDQDWITSKFYDGYFTQKCTNYNFCISSSNLGYIDENTYVWNSEMKMLLIRVKMETENGYTSTFKIPKYYKNIKFSVGEKKSYINVNGNYYYNGDKEWRFTANGMSVITEYQEINPYYIDIVWNAVYVGIPFESNPITDPTSINIPFEIWLNFYRNTSEEELLFAQIADSCPWLENKLIDFSYYYNHGILNKSEYNNLINLIQNDLRITNGQLMLYSQLYYWAIHAKTKILAELTNTIDKIGAEFQANILDPYVNKNAVLSTNSFQLALQSLIPEISNKTELINYDETLSDYVNKYISADQRFLKNIYDFRSYFNEKISFLQNGLYKYYLTIPIASSSDTEMFAFNNPYYNLLVNNSIDSKDFLNLPLYQKETNNTYSLIDNKYKINEYNMDNGNYYIALTTPNHMLKCDSVGTNVHSTGYKEDKVYYEIYFITHLNSIPEIGSWTSTELQDGKYHYINSTLFAGGTNSTATANEALWEIECIGTTSTGYDFTISNKYHYNTGNENSSTYNIFFNSSALFTNLEIKYRSLAFSEIKQNFFNNYFLNSNINNYTKQYMDSLYIRETGNYYKVYSSDSNYTMNLPIYSSGHLELPIDNIYYDCLDYLENADLYEIENDYNYFYYANFPLTEIFMKSKSFTDTDNIIEIDQNSEETYQPIAFVNINNFNNYYRRVRRSKKQNVESIKSLFGNDYRKELLTKSDKRTGFDNKGKTQFEAISSGFKTSHKFDDFSAYLKGHYFFITGGSYTNLINQYLKNTYNSYLDYAGFGRYFPHTSFTLLSNTELQPRSDMIYPVIQQRIENYRGFDSLGTNATHQRNHDSSYYYQTGFWRVLGSSSYINKNDEYYFLVDSDEKYLTNLASFQSGLQYNFDSLGTDERIALNKIAYYPLDSILDSVLTTRNYWGNSTNTDIKSVLRSILNVNASEITYANNRFTITRTGEDPLKFFVLHNEDYEIKSIKNYLNGINTLQEKLIKISNLYNDYLYVLKTDILATYIDKTDFTKNLYVPQGQYDDFELITSNTNFDKNGIYFYGDKKERAYTLNQYIIMKNIYFAKSNSYSFNSQLSSSGIDNTQTIPINYYTREVIDNTYTNWKKEAEGYIKFEYNQNVYSFNTTFYSTDSIYNNKTVSGTYSCEHISINSYTNGTYWYNYKDSNEDFLRQQAALIESNLESYWITAKNASKYCKYFIPDNWQDSINGNQNPFAASIIDCCIHNNIKEPYLKNNFLPEIKIINNQNKYLFKFCSTKNIKINPWTQVDTAEELKDDYNKYNQNLSYGNIVTLTDICDKTSLLYNSVLKDLFNSEKLNLKSKGTWTGTQLYKTSYYQAISGGTTWNDILSFLTNNALTKNNNFGGWYEMMLIALKNGNYNDYIPSEYNNALQNHNKIWETIYKLYPNIIIEKSYKNEDAIDSETLLKMSKLAFEDYKDIERQYNITMIDINHLKGYTGQELKIGDSIQLDADEYYDEYDDIKKSLQQYLFITDQSYSLRKDSDIAITVNTIKYQDKVIKELIKLIR